MRLWKPLAVAILAVTAIPFATGQLSRDAPAMVPSAEGWERISGDVELDRPRVAVSYEFFVNPERPLIYEIVRYRVTRLGAKGSAPARGNEKLQWDRDGRDLRRFECMAGDAADQACAWREMDKDAAEYRDEVPMLLAMYAAHNRKQK